MPTTTIRLTAAVGSGCRPIRRTFEAKLQQAVELGYQRGERTHWTKTVHTCQQVLQRSDAL
jgi:hypothetical protein